MRVGRVRIENVRSIAAAELAPEPELTVLCGENGQGKTNLLEAVWLLTGSRSFRGAKDAELIRDGEAYGVVEGRVETENRVCDVRLFIGAAGPGGAPARTASVNGVDYGRAANIAGVFTAVQFQPDHLNLVKGSAEARRRFIDAALCQLYPSYVATLRRYARILAQRNALLKSFRGGGQEEALLDVLDAHLARFGGEIIARRAAHLALIAPEAERTYRDIACGRETLKLAYRPCCESGEELLRLVQSARRESIRAGFTTVGPHREDISIAVNGRDARRLASQGQQRSAVLSLKLAEGSAAQAVTGEHPVMLLDDVLSELDERRQAYLLQRVEHRQTIVTACDEKLFTRAGGKIYRVENGAVREA